MTVLSEDQDAEVGADWKLSVRCDDSAYYDIHFVGSTRYIEFLSSRQILVLIVRLVVLQLLDVDALLNIFAVEPIHNTVYISVVSQCNFS